MESFLESLPLRDPDFAIETLRAGAHANRTASCRHASIDHIRHPWRLVATGDLHDNPLSLLRLCALAGLGIADPPPDAPPPCHLTLHEIIHPPLDDDQPDLSHRALIRVAALKARHPDLVHTLLANHELAQIVGAGIIKDGVNVVQAFNDGVESVYSHRAPDVQKAIADFIRSMPLALRASFAPPSECTQSGGSRDAHHADLLCAHSLPSPDAINKFDLSILNREITPDDLVPRRGSAHLLVWGRASTEAQIQSLAHAWNIHLFILGHEKSPTGAHAIADRVAILNSDHAHARCVTVDSSDPPASAQDLVSRTMPLSG